MVLENAYMQVEIAEMGAELMRIYDREAGSELLWWGDGAYWKRRSPVLFPNVGKTFGNVMKIDGVRYPTCQHGFARDMLFECEVAGSDFARFVLRSTPETLEKYPSAFELRISYKLQDRELRVIWAVKNPSEKDMYFTIGGHPAFCFANAADSKADYMIRFPGRDALSYLLLDPASGTACADEKRSLPLEDGCLALTEELFAHDALILDGGQVTEAWLCRRDGAARIGVRCEGFPNFGVWSVKGAPFVCLEPWMGRCDDCGFEGELSEKPNVNHLPGGAEFEKSYSILLPER